MVRDEPNSRLYVLFFTSGLAALVYEISWSRQVGLVIGQSARSAALVLAAFFAGMGFGQFIGGRLASRRPLLGYGIAELLAAGGACAVPALLNLVAAWPWPELWCAVVLLPATVALGASFPLMARTVGHPSIARAYAVNTAGGLLGVVASAVCLPVVGVCGCGYLAAALSAVCGLTACVLATQSVEPESPQTTTTPNSHPGWMVLSGISGFGTLALEVLYAHLFSLVLHNSTYTFAAVVAVFLLALAGSAALADRLCRRFEPREVAISATGLGAVAVLISVVLFVWLTRLDYFAAGDNFASYLVATAGLVTLIVLPPVLLLGLAFPVALRAAGQRSESAGRLAAANTLAGAAGALFADFVALPAVGLWAAFAVIAAMFTLIALALLAANRRWVLAATLLSITAGFLALLASIPESLPGEVVVRRWQGAHGWVDVVRDEKTGARHIRQNLHYRHGSTAAVLTEGRLGHLPLLLHPSPNEVAFIGVGTGLTAAPAVNDPDVQRLVIAELIPEVVEAARLFADVNGGVIDHPRTKIALADGRNYLSRTRHRFDVLVSDLFVPWESRAGYLYTVEFYEIARRRLKPGGLFCQWLALYQLGPDEFEMIADSFAAVFPHSTLWWGQLNGHYPILGLIGSEEPLAQTVRRDEAWDARPDPELRTPADLAGFRLGRWPRRDGRLNTDEHPWLEFTAPLSHKSHRTLHGPALRDYFDRVLAELPVDMPNVKRTRAIQRLGLFGEVKP